MLSVSFKTFIAVYTPVLNPTKAQHKYSLKGPVTSSHFTHVTSIWYDRNSLLYKELVTPWLCLWLCMYLTLLNCSFASRTYLDSCLTMDTLLKLRWHSILSLKNSGMTTPHQSLLLLASDVLRLSLSSNSTLHSTPDHCLGLGRWPTPGRWCRRT